MTIVCDCGMEVFSLAVSRLGPRDNGQSLVKSVGVHVDVRPGPPAVLFSVICEMCGRMPIEVTRSAPAPGDTAYQPVTTDVGELN